MSASGIAALVGAAAPGVAQGIGNYMQTSADQKQAQGALPTTNAASDQTKDDFLANPSNPAFHDPNHPAWGVLSNMTGLPQQGIPAPPMPQMPAAQMGAPINTMGAPMVQPGGGATTQFENGGPVGYQNGGVVRQNFGKPTITPEFTKGPAIPVGPNSGIVPASTEGQILTMDAGGMVPDGFTAQPGVSGGGRGASLVEGFQAGQNIGHNLQQAWNEHSSRKATGEAAAQALTANSDGGENYHPQGVLGDAKDSVEGFFHHLFGGTLDDNHKPNADQALPPGAAPPAAGDGTTPAPPPAAGATPGAVPPGGQPITPAPAGGPPPAQAIPTGAPPAAAPSVGAGPGIPVQSQPGQPKSVNPEDPQGMAGQVAQQTAAKTIVASDPNVAAGIASKTPEASGKAHSLTPEYWQQSNKLMQKAVYKAALAGEDPAKVYESLTAMRNAHFQGQVLKQAATAYQAFQNNDMKNVEQAIKNINYYLPNGQDIEVKKATAQDAATDKTGNTRPGDIMHANPYYGFYGHEGEPQYIKVDQQYLQSLGQGALDPQKIQEAQLKAYGAQQEAQSNRIKAQGEFMTGQGRQLTGAASFGKMTLAQQSAEVDRRLKIAAGNKDQAEANWYNTRQPGGNNGQPKITTANLLQVQKQVADMTDKLVQGQPTTAQPMIPSKDANGQVIMGPDGKPVMEMNMSPGAGKGIPDPNRIPSYLKDVTPEGQENIKILGGQIAAANLSSFASNPSRAIELAARINNYEKNPTTHVNPKTGAKEKDFGYDNKNGIAHVWVGNDYVNVYLQPNVADEAGGGSPEAPPPGGNSAGATSGGGNEGPDAFQ